MKEVYKKPLTKIDEFKTADVVTTSFTGIENGAGDDD
jgi:hypothetical protein